MVQEGLSGAFEEVQLCRAEGGWGGRRPAVTSCFVLTTKAQIKGRLEACFGRLDRGKEGGEREAELLGTAIWEQLRQICG